MCERAFGRRESLKSAPILRNEGCVKGKKRNGFLTFKRVNELAALPDSRCAYHVDVSDSVW